MSSLSLQDVKDPQTAEIVVCVLDQIVGPRGTLTRALDTKNNLTAHDRGQAMTTQHNGIDRRSD